MKTSIHHMASTATLIAGIWCFNGGSTAIAVMPMPGFGTLTSATAEDFSAFETIGGVVNLTDAKLYGGTNTTIIDNNVSITWVISLMQPSLAGHSISGNYDYDTRETQGYDVSFSQLYIDPDGSGSAVPQLIANNTGDGSFSDTIASILLPVGATEISVVIAAQGATPGLYVPNNSIDLFYAVPEPSSLALAAMSVACLAVFARKRKK